MSEDVSAGPLSWRDVYRAVSDAEARILAAVEKAAAQAEDRSKELEKQVTVNTAQIHALEQWQLVYTASDQGKSAVFGNLKSAVTLTVSIMVGFSASIAILTFVFQALGVGTMGTQ